jgi:pyrimidine oxygenase
MDFGVFIPIANNGWIASTTAPHYQATFDLNKAIVQKAEELGFGFALSMVKFRGYGGATEHWDYAMESLTLTAALAAVTSKIQLYASVAIPTMHPAIVARMAATIDSVAPGRFGVNIVAGWSKEEYVQMGLWPGDDFYDYRYEYASEYVSILRELWETGQSDFTGKYFQLEDCRCLPMPVDMKVVGAGSSPRGREFAAEFCDYNFTNVGSSTAKLAEANAGLKEYAERAGRDVKTYALYMVIMDDTDELAQARVDRYNEGADAEAILCMKGQASRDANSQGIAALMAAMELKAVQDAAIVGSPATVAAKMREIAAVEGTAGIMLIFDDFLEGVERFGREVIPLVNS